MEYLGGLLLLLIVAGLMWVSWYIPRRRRMNQAREALAHIRKVHEANAAEIARAAR